MSQSTPTPAPSCLKQKCEHAIRSVWTNRDFFMNAEFDSLISKPVTTQDVLRSLRLATSPDPSYEKLLKKAELKLNKAHRAVNDNGGQYTKDVTVGLCKIFMDIETELFYRVEGVTMRRKDEERPPTMRRRLKRVDADVDLGKMGGNANKGVPGGRPVIVTKDKAEEE